MALNDAVLAIEFDESSGNAADSSGNGRTMTNNGTAGYTTGLLANCADLGAANITKWFSRTDASGIGTGSYSMAAWVNFYSLPLTGTNMQIFYIGNTANNVSSGYYCTNPSGTQLVHFERVRDGVAADSVNITTTLSTSAWHLIGYSYDGSTVTPYIDGAAQTTVASSGSGSSGSTLGTSIGSLNPSGAQLAFSLNDLTLLYTRALSGAEWTTLWNSGAGFDPYAAVGGGSTRDARNFLLIGVG